MSKQSNLTLYIENKGNKLVLSQKTKDMVTFINIDYESIT